MAKVKFRKWLNQLIGMGIQGGATAAGATFGLAGVSSLGVPVSPLDGKQVIAVFLCGFVSRALEYLKATPIPNFEGTETNTTTTTTVNTNTKTPSNNEPV
jgi:hypothetical protein